MSPDSTFKGTLTIRSTSIGFAVLMEGETDAHDLGHALAGAITHYIDRAIKANPHGDADELREFVLSGIRCGLENNPEPIKKH